ncbi:MAG: hypothetical protein PHU25_15335 [Deltaproteobacteria bacterium]|nr:hypothetical protein [Deltaproteobacteria bacterium]
MTRETETVAFDEAVAAFRSLEQAEQVVVLLDDLALQKLLSVWPATPWTVTPSSARKPPSDDLPALWDWLWSQRGVETSSLARSLRLSAPQTQALFEAARRQRLIYPDGTIHGVASQYLRARIAVEIGGRPAKNQARRS